VMLYDRPVAELMVEASTDLADRLRPGDVVDWFAQHYPKVKATTVRAHVIGLTVNDPSRKHYAALARRQPLFFKTPNGWIERFDPDIHLTDEPTGSDALDDEDLGLLEPDVSDPDSAPAGEGTHEFYLEAYLEEFLVSNWQHLNWGRQLRIWEGPMGETGHQLVTPVGRLDLLCEDIDSGALVVVELKRGRPSDRVVGQTARYMGWVAQHLAEGRAVEGIIVAHEVDDRLTYAVQPVPGLSLLVYEINFALRPPSANAY
jgi:Endonuclease NucS C-terminal domain